MRSPVGSLNTGMVFSDAAGTLRVTSVRPSEPLVWGPQDRRYRAFRDTGVGRQSWGGPSDTPVWDLIGAGEGPQSRRYGPSEICVGLSQAGSRPLEVARNRPVRALRSQQGTLRSWRRAFMENLVWLLRGPWDVLTSPVGHF